jgi:glycosyltransferase involved in cell wall biosynthesis
MRIGIDGRGTVWYRGTGIGTYTDQLLHHLYTLDRENTYSIFFPQDELFPWTDLGNFQSIQLDTHKDTYLQDTVVDQFLTKQPFDVYHVPQNGIGLPRDKYCPYIITLHDVIPYVLPETCSKTYLKTFMEQMNHIVKNADHIITVSNHAKNDIYQVLGVPLSKITVTPLAPEKIYHPMDKKKCISYLKNHYDLDREYILYIGGMNPRKNIGALIDAFHLCQKKLSKNYCIVIGGAHGRSYESLRLRCEALGLTDDVIFPGYIPQEELPVFYNGASLFVYPSLYEGFGLPPLEAMACGVPTICSNTTSIPEVVGNAALLIDPHDVENLAEKIALVLESPSTYAIMIHKGLQRAKQYTWEKTAKKTLEIYLSF